MNERIKQLLAECTQQSIDGPYDNPYVDQEKFAEIIVQDCCDILQSLSTEYVAAGKIQGIDNGNQQRAIAIAEARIKAHFRDVSHLVRHQS